MAKSPDAFRTISEVSEILDTPPHVLRFWESKFKHIKPVKGPNKRRMYRASDCALLVGIKFLLHERGMTIKGVQKLISDRGVKYVASLSPETEKENPLFPARKAPAARAKVAKKPHSPDPRQPDLFSTSLVELPPSAEAQPETNIELNAEDKFQTPLQSILTLLRSEHRPALSADTSRLQVLHDKIAALGA